MKAKLLILAIMAITLYACSKDSFTDRPGLTLNSVSDTAFRPGQQVTFKFTLTHKEAETINDTLWIIRKFFTCPFKTADTTYYQLAAFDATSKQKAEIEYSYFYGQSSVPQGPCSKNGSSPRNDSAYYFFWIKDKHGNASDTSKSPKIILFR